MAEVREPTDEQMERYADAALETLKRLAQDDGFGVAGAFLTFGIEGTDLGGSAAVGFTGERELLAFLLAQAEDLAQALGGKLRVVPIIGRG